MKGSIVAVLCALLFVFIYTSTITRLVTDTEAARPTGFMKDLHWRTSNRTTVRRYLGFTAIAAAVGLLTWAVLQEMTRDGKRSGRNRFEPARPERRRRRKSSSRRASSSRFVPRDADPSSSSSVSARPVARATEGEVTGEEPSRSIQAAGSPTRVARSSTASSADPLAALKVGLEVDLFGSGELSLQCGRGVLVSRDDTEVVFRLAAHSEMIPWGSGDRVHGYFWESEGRGFLFEVRVLERRTGDGVLLVATAPSKLIQQQRRVYVRVACRENFRFLHVRDAQSKQLKQLHATRSPRESSASDRLDSESVEATNRFEEQALYEGLAEDLSVGGFRMITNAPLEEGDYITISQLRPVGNRQLVGRVSVRLGSHGQDFSRYGVEFVEIDSAAKDELTRVVFRLQRDSLKARDAIG